MVQLLKGQKATESKGGYEPNWIKILSSLSSVWIKNVLAWIRFKFAKLQLKVIRIWFK